MRLEGPELRRFIVSGDLEITTRTDRLNAVIDDIAVEYRVEPELVLGDSRNRRVAWARQELCRRLYDHWGYSLPIIGRLISRDHTTVLHGVRAARRRLADMDELQREIQMRLADSSRKRRERQGKRRYETT